MDTKGRCEPPFCYVYAICDNQLHDDDVKHEPILMFIAPGAWNEEEAVQL